MIVKTYLQICLVTITQAILIIIINTTPSMLTQIITLMTYSFSVLAVIVKFQKAITIPTKKKCRIKTLIDILGSDLENDNDKRVNSTEYTPTNSDTEYKPSKKHKKRKHRTRSKKKKNHTNRLSKNQYIYDTLPQYYRCGVCNNNLKTEKTCLAHLKKVHKIDDIKKRRRKLLIVKNNIKNTKKYKCNICNKQFRKLKKFDKHMLSHSSNRPFICDICNKQFSNKNNHDDHQKNHYKYTYSYSKKN